MVVGLWLLLNTLCLQIGFLLFKIYITSAMMIKKTTILTLILDIKGSNRIEIGYGKKRAGIFCVGGVCKEVPSSNGFSLNISSSF